MSKTLYIDKIYKMINYTNAVDTEDPDYVFISNKINLIEYTQLILMYEEMVNLSTSANIQSGASRRDFNLIIKKYIEREEDRIWEQFELSKYLELLPAALHGAYWFLREKESLQTHECIEKMAQEGFLNNVMYAGEPLPSRAVELFDCVDKKSLMVDLLEKGTSYVRDYHLKPAFKSMVTRHIIAKSSADEFNRLENKNDSEKKNFLVETGGKRVVKITPPRKF